MSQHSKVEEACVIIPILYTTIWSTELFGPLKVPQLRPEWEIGGSFHFIMLPLLNVAWF